jgi:hypothetical protein
MRTIRPALAAALLLAAGAASAQLLSSAALDRPSINTGETARLTVQFDVPSGINCGIRVHWGDGSEDNFKVNQAKDVPLVASHAYAKPGSYTVKVEPKTQGMTTMKCGGRNQEVALAVKAPAVAATAAPAKAAASKPKAKPAAKPAAKPVKAASGSKAS